MSKVSCLCNDICKDINSISGVVSDDFNILYLKKLKKFTKYIVRKIDKHFEDEYIDYRYDRYEG